MCKEEKMKYQQSLFVCACQCGHLRKRQFFCLGFTAEEYLQIKHWCGYGCFRLAAWPNIGYKPHVQTQAHTNAILFAIPTTLQQHYEMSCHKSDVNESMTFVTPWLLYSHESDIFGYEWNISTVTGRNLLQMLKVPINKFSWVWGLHLCDGVCTFFLSIFSAVYTGPGLEGAQTPFLSEPSCLIEYNPSCVLGLRPGLLQIDLPEIWNREVSR